MFTLTRRSPVHFAAPAARTAKWDDFEIVLEYKQEGTGPWLIDLSHRPKWDLQDSDPDQIKPWGRTIPSDFNGSELAGGLLVNRMNRTQAQAWQLTGPALESPGPYSTDIQDGLTLLALAGPNTLAFLEHISPLDLADPGRKTPYLVQGPVMHIPCQTVVFNKEAAPLVLIAFSRGYGQTMAEALLETGHNLGLRPAGEQTFLRCLDAATQGR